MVPAPSPSAAFLSSARFCGLWVISICEISLELRHGQPPVRWPTSLHSQNSCPQSCCNGLLATAVSILAGPGVPTAFYVFCCFFFFFLFFGRTA
jgi:hypothetical protein